MLSRRQLIGVGFGFGCSICGSSALSQTNGVRRSCNMPAAEARPYLNAADQVVAYQSGMEEIVLRSGNASLDRALAISMARMSRLFSVLPGFCYINEPNGPNAFATDAVKVNNHDGTVMFGLQLLSQILSQHPVPDAAILSVCAHEFGHIVQYKRDLIPRLKRGQRTVRRVELHADFISGYFAAIRKAENPDFSSATFAHEAHSIGDFQTDHPNHHGTPTERANAVVAGFEAYRSQKLNFSDAIEAGFQHVGA